METKMQYEIVSRGFRYEGKCVKCGDSTNMRDKKDGYLLRDENGSYAVLCRNCNCHVHSIANGDAYEIDSDGDFCRSGSKFTSATESGGISRTRFTPTTSESGTQPEDLSDGSAFV